MTLPINADLLSKARKIAVERDTSLTGLIREFLSDLVRRDDLQNEPAASELEELFRTSPMIVGRKGWSRSDLYER